MPAIPFYSQLQPINGGNSYWQLIRARDIDLLATGGCDQSIEGHTTQEKCNAQTDGNHYPSGDGHWMEPGLDSLSDNDFLIVGVNTGDDDDGNPVTDQSHIRRITASQIKSYIEPADPLPTIVAMSIALG